MHALVPGWLRSLFILGIIVALMPLAVSLQGCATAQIKPQNPSEAITAARVDLTAIAKTTVASRKAGLVDDELKTEIVAGLKIARDLLDGAELLLLDGGAEADMESKILRAVSLASRLAVLAEGRSR
jgi:hypothetical protein